MARIIVSDCEKKEKSPRKQDIVKATYSVNIEEGLFQIETYGSSSRQNPDSASQTIQMDKESAQQLIALLEKELFLQKSRLSSAQDSPLQQIFYGAPGTGKSHEVKKLTGELLDNGDEVDLPNVFRMTFHPDTDYASFVGCYKPTMKPTSKEEKTLTGKDEEIVYEFVPQVFTDAYVYAYKNSDQPTYLVIEEINRGNCVLVQRSL